MSFSPATSGELRGYKSLSDRQEHDRENNRFESEQLSEGDKRVVKAIEDRISKGQYERVGLGNAGEVIILNVWENGDPNSETEKPWVIKKMRVPNHARDANGDILPHERQRFAEAFEHEMKMHDIAYSLLEDFRKQYPQVDVARIPKPLAGFATENEFYQVMEYIPGESLLDVTVRKWLTQYYEEGDVLPDSVMTPSMKQKPKRPFEQWGRKELLSALHDDKVIFMLPPSTRDKINDGGGIDASLFAELVGQSRSKFPEKYPFITEQQGDQIIRTMILLHRKGFWHRDLHANNIMLSPDGQAHIIDFGFSLYDPDRRTREYDPHDPIYKVWTRHGLVQRPDEEILSTIDRLLYRSPRNRY